MNIVNTAGIVYLVDLENVGTKLLCQHIRQHQDASYVIFYSDSTSAPDAILERIPETVSVTFTYCRTGGKNAMDFCICAAAGRMSVGTGAVMRILSNDKSYDLMFHMLHEQGIRISREIVACQQAKGPDPSSANSDWRDNVPIIAAIKANVPKQYWNDVIAVIPGAVSRKEAHEMLQAILPQKIVAGVYNKLKKHIPKEVVR